MRCTVCKQMLWGVRASYESYVLICHECGTVVKNKLTVFKGTPRNESERREIMDLVRLNLAAEVEERVKFAEDLTEKLCKLRLVTQQED